MSVDTEDRTIALINSLIITPNSYYLVDAGLNEDLREQSSGPFITVSFDTFRDALNGVSVGSKQYLEEGTVIFEIRTETGTGTRELETIRDQIRDAMRDLKVSPAVGEQGILYYFDLNQQPVFTEERDDSRLSWKVLRVFLNYTKYYQ